MEKYNIQTGYVYHIKDSYFKLANDSTLMKNHENGGSRPNYFCIKRDNSDIMWFIPMSSKIKKYKNLQREMIEKHGKCNKIVIGNYRGKDQAFLIQNIFPITAKYIDHIDTVNNKALQVAKPTRLEIIKNVEEAFKLKDRGIKNIIYPDVDAIAKKLIKEIEQAKHPKMDNNSLDELTEKLYHNNGKLTPQELKSEINKLSSKKKNSETEKMKEQLKENYED